MAKNEPILQAFEKFLKVFNEHLGPSFVQEHRDILKECFFSGVAVSFAMMKSFSRESR